MTANRTNLPATDGCSTRLDDAFAKLESGLVAVEARVQAAPDESAADLGEYEEALDRIDRQLNGLPEQQTGLPADSTQKLQAVPPLDTPQDAKDAASPEDPGEPAPSARSNVTNLALVAPAQTPPSEAQPVPHNRDVDTLWEKRAEGGTPLERLVGTTQNLAWLQQAIDSRSTKVAEHMRWERVADVLADAQQLCAEFDLPTAGVRARFAISAFDSDRLDRLALEIRELVRHIHHDLQTCTMLPVPRHRASMLQVTLDDRTQKAFPAAAIDIADAARCVGFGMHGAAVFHLLRAAERGRVATARAVRLRNWDLEAPDWSSTITALNKRMAAMRRWPAGPARKRAKDFLRTLVSDARELEAVHRRMTEGATFEECHAVATWLTVRDFLESASERVSEGGDTLLGPDDFIPQP